MLQEKKNKYELQENTPKYLSQCNDYITKFLLCLRDLPELMFKVIMNSNINEIKDSLKTFLNEYFYENILSSNYLEDEYLSLLYRLLKVEINSFKGNSIQFFDVFLNEKIGIILEGLIKKIDIKFYFNIILKPIIEHLENKEEENKDWLFKVEDITNEMKMKQLKYEKMKEEREKKKKEKEKKKRSKKEKDDKKNNNNTISEYESEYYYKNEQITIEDTKEREEFLKNYIKDLLKKDLINRMEENKNEKIKEYFFKQINFYKDEKKDQHIFANSKFLENISKSGRKPEKIIDRYRNSFLQVKNCIEILIKSLNENTHLIPYSIKCICKIIKILIKEKFNSISDVDINSFISKFFFQKLFKNFLTKPDYYALISEGIISESSTKKYKLIYEIIEKLVSGNFYNSNVDSDFTVFNWIFIEEYPKIIIFFDKLSNVILPNYIERLSSGKINENDFSYNYFIENPKEPIHHKSICFTINDFETIYNIIKRNESKFFDKNITPQNEDLKIFGITYKKLQQEIYQEIIKNLKKNDNENKKNYLLITQINFNEKFNEIINIELKNSCFNIPEIKIKEDNKNPEEIQQINTKNNIIKTKNFLSKLLYNYRNLNYSDFSEGTTSNIFSILTEFAKFLKSGIFVLDNRVPSEWYANSLQTLLQKIPDEYKENDYDKIYKELTNDIENSIIQLDFKSLSIIFDRLKYSRRAYQNINDNKNILNEISHNKKLLEFITKIKIKMEFKIDMDNKIIEIDDSDENDAIFPDNFLLDESPTKVGIHNFIKCLPDLKIYQQMQDYDLFDFEEELNLNKTLEKYFKIIKTYLANYFSELNQKELTIINNKFNSYSMRKLYDKIYPLQPDCYDIKIFQTCVRLSWIQPHHLIKAKGFILDNFLKNTVEIIQKLDDEKSPIGKCELIKKVIDIINSTIVFNSSGSSGIGIDDSLPFLQYAIIKAQPNRLNSNIRYMNLYISEELQSQNMGSIIAQLLLVVEKMKEFQYTDLIGVTEEEYINNCNNVIKSEDNKNII